jgi:alpha-methylacyl-CoA racemase
VRGKPLAGVRVLDLTRLLPGPMATLHLADLGADVIKIEDTAAGDYARTMGDGGGEGQASYFFRAINRNKRSLCLDLKRPEGREAFLKLARRADVILEGFRPGVVDRLGVGYGVVKAINPHIVYCAITGYGQDGPYARKAGHDINYIGYAGVLDQVGPAGGAPAIPGLQIGDLLGGALTAVMGVLAALVDARTSGQGRYVDVSMADAVLAHAVFPLQSHLSAGHAVPRGADMLTGGRPNYNVYRTSDGRYLAVGALEERFWAVFCETIGRPDLAAKHDTAGPEADAVTASVAAILAKQPLAHWSKVFAEVDCCVSPVLTMGEVLADPQFRARGMVVEADGMPQFALPLKVDDFLFTVDRMAPSAGEQSDEILREIGYDDAAIAALRESGVI